MRKSLLLLSALCLVMGLSAQTTVFDYETAATSVNFTYFENGDLGDTDVNVIANPNPTGVNTSAMVAEFVERGAGDGVQPYAGLYSNPNPMEPLVLPLAGQICMDVHAPAVTSATLKLEDGTAGNWEFTQDLTTSGEWEKVCFDITTEIGGVVPAGQTYPKIVLFFNILDTPAEDQTYYFDNLVIEEEELMDVNVTFSVDMNDYAASFTTVFVSGTFNEWAGNSNPMTDQGGGIWSVTLPIPAGEMEYKFQVDEWTDDEKFVPGEDCTVTDGGFTNRFALLTGDVDLGTPCWGSCFACGDEIEITFNIGMNAVGASPDGVWLAGGGTFGDPGGVYQMSDDDLDGVYTIKVYKQPGFMSDYTFANGNCPDYSCKENIGGQDCAVEPFSDRTTGMLMENTVFNTCFAQCVETTECGDPPMTRMVTFQVDMNNYLDAGNTLTTMYVSGSYEGWGGPEEDNAMSDDDGDNIWTKTVELNDGTYEYKFLADSWDTSESLIDGDDCTLTSGEFINRLIAIDADVTLDAVCYGYCVTCDLVYTEELESLGIDFRVQPTVTSDAAWMTFGTEIPQDAQVQLINTAGQVLKTLPVNNTRQQLDLSDVAGGLYFVRLQVGSAHGVLKVVKQ